MKAMIVILAMVASSISSAAILSNGMSCSEARALVESKGRVYFQTGQTQSGVYGLGGNTINRVVSSRSAVGCQRDERAVRVTIPTATGSCAAGYTCQQRDWNN